LLNFVISIPYPILSLRVALKTECPKAHMCLIGTAIGVSLYSMDYEEIEGRCLCRMKPHDLEESCVGDKIKANSLKRGMAATI
jgi:hypothetical protein